VVIFHMGSRNFEAAESQSDRRAVARVRSPSSFSDEQVGSTRSQPRCWRLPRRSRLRRSFAVTSTPQFSSMAGKAPLYSDFLEPTGSTSKAFLERMLLFEYIHT
jgi:hypothetical protein